MKPLLSIFLISISACTIPSSTNNSIDELHSQHNDSISHKAVLDRYAANDTSQPNDTLSRAKTFINPEGNIIETRFLLPEGFERIKVEQGSFAEYLRKLPLKPDGSNVLYYDGTIKYNDNIYDAVVEMDIGNKDLQQCADAIIRLRAEYLYQTKQYVKIHFNFTNGFRCDYLKWTEGNRIIVTGNKTEWKKLTSPSNTYQDFRNYLDIIFTYAGTLSLANELRQVNYEEMQIGDVLIQGGTPGHVVIVVDMAKNKITGEKIYLLAQSYMPAQEIQILKNPENNDLSPWYRLDINDAIIETPEWTFKPSDLKRF